MRFARLRLAGFKSFVEPAELIIRDGLTGIVGPNGCGKSNLLEAIRWVMGESSPKSLRVASGGDGMDAVIFAGTARRPARDVAEIALTLENHRRSAPPRFNEHETIQVSRTIWRGEGSSYAINGREVRQKDVQLLFADAATGAQSPALVGQGRVAAIIAARPSERRLLLEEAAGISGLAVRRKEAETRLRATDANLVRLEDSLQEKQGRIATLRRQARSAQRYRELSSRIRSVEGALLRLQWDAARHDLAVHEAALADAETKLAEAVKAAEAAAREQALAAVELPSRRQSRADADARMHDLRSARAALVAERNALAQRITDLETNLRTTQADANRTEAQARDSTEVRARLVAERVAAAERLATAEADINPGSEAVVLAEQRATEAERSLAVAMEAHATLVADARSARTAAEAARQRVNRIGNEIARLSAERQRLDADAANARLRDDMNAVETALEAQLAELGRAQEAIVAAEQDFQAAASARETAEQTLSDARSRLQSLEAEAAALERMRARGQKRPLVRVPVEVQTGYEAALAAALGDDINAAVGGSAPGGQPAWRGNRGAEGDPALPPGVLALRKFVKIPQELVRSLAQVGVIDMTPSPAMIDGLYPGQRLVNREGWLWRWDGFELPPGGQALMVAEELSQDNRRHELAALMEEPRASVVAAEAQLTDLRARLRSAQEAERQARARRAMAERTRDQLSARLQELQATDARHVAKYAALDASLERLTTEMADARGEAERAEAQVAALPDPAVAAERLSRAQAGAQDARAALAGARSTLATTQQMLSAAKSRIEAIDRENDAWMKRDADAAAALVILRERMDRLCSDHAQLMAEPDILDDQLAALEREIAIAEAACTEAAQAVSVAEAALSDLEGRARAAQAVVADGRERRAMLEAHVSQAQSRMGQFRQEALQRFGCQPQQLETADGVEGSVLEQQLSRLNSERERIGIVNLRADIELKELEAELVVRAAEREDLLTAIARLRGSIGALNREGRTRLMQAYVTVDRNFRELFVNLFGGGTAELQLIESDDPLHAGLEVRAQPPGKKLQSLSLLSGGEQALTACALIFALFLTNPAPICVLDEVDAPLDDANVERFVRLLEHMVSSTETRFLIVTHNPITMSRMDQLYGVTMGEPGVSQLVSVELADASALLPG